MQSSTPLKLTAIGFSLGQFEVPGSLYPSGLWLAAIETLQREQDLTSLAPKRGLISAQPIERTGWQVGQADKGAGDIVGLIGSL